MFTISRQIEIDAGHRIPYHDSKCRFLHGHRWKIVAHVSAPNLIAPDPERPDSGMVVDFGIIKQVLMDCIHNRFDHRMILWAADPLLTGPKSGRGGLYLDNYLATFALEDSIREDSIRVVPCIPTSEGLAEYWAGLIIGPLERDSAGRCQLVALDVWETPNCKATYRPTQYPHSDT